MIFWVATIWLEESFRSSSWFCQRNSEGRDFTFSGSCLLSSRSTAGRDYHQPIPSRLRRDTHQPYRWLFSRFRTWYKLFEMSSPPLVGSYSRGHWTKRNPTHYDEHDRDWIDHRWLCLRSGLGDLLSHLQYHASASTVMLVNLKSH